MKTTRRTFLGGAAVVAVTARTAVAVQETSRETISSLFSQWAANPDAQVGADYSGMSQEQLDATFEEYSSLQQRIIDAVPTTAKEVAQQYIVATDNGASEIPEELFDRLRQMAWGASA
ncbi:hypothetical protein [Rhizobium rhizogenes]|uniref:hypothetical protein n=1 Tax=Rhizobium rhizogenes TaxID=359 RepID=UPI0022C2DC67|nr:hypothetical protein [Rhizobium rhizogenes]MCZ7463529.1 hypothetical protein [Rhizobium rhizogenes]